MGKARVRLVHFEGGNLHLEAILNDIRANPVYQHRAEILGENIRKEGDIACAMQVI
jgi:hypothetical protein